jgi:hypothetical protein
VNEFAVLQVFGHAEVSDARCVELGCEVGVAVRMQAKEAAGSKSKQDAHCMAKARCVLHASGMLIALSRLGAYSLATLTTLGWSLLMLLIGDYSDRVTALGEPLTDLVDEYIRWLQVTVHDALRVEVLAVCT